VTPRADLDHGQTSAKPAVKGAFTHDQHEWVKRLLTGYLPLVLAVVVMIAPLLWMLVSSLKTRPEIFTVPLQWLPERPYGGNYAEVIERYPFGRFFLNSVIVTTVGAGIKVLLAMFTAYALVFIRFPAKKLVFIVIIVALMVPPQVVVVPNYTLIADLGWQNTYLGIIVPGLGTVAIAGLLGVPLSTMLIYGFLIGPPTAVLTTLIYGRLLRYGLWNKAEDEVGFQE
jgi:sn-glycerol 3-phosphate transport system permease protein